MPIEEVQAGKKSHWLELEITGIVLEADVVVFHPINFSFRFHSQVPFETSVPTCGRCSI